MRKMKLQGSPLSHICKTCRAVSFPTLITGFCNPDPDATVEIQTYYEEGEKLAQDGANGEVVCVVMAFALFKL